MNKKWTMLTTTTLLLCAISIVSACKNGDSPTHHHQTQKSEPSPSAMAGGRKIPAYFTQPPDPKSLPPTLAPEQFTGETREAYQIAREIPVTLAQLPCFCYCDAIGHKSLHSCYETDHSVGCGICKVSAIVASKLKKEGLSDKQIRERLIAQYQ